CACSTTPATTVIRRTSPRRPSRWSGRMRRASPRRRSTAMLRASLSFPTATRCSPRCRAARAGPSAEATDIGRNSSDAPPREPRRALGWSSFWRPSALPANGFGMELVAGAGAHLAANKERELEVRVRRATTLLAMAAMTIYPSWTLFDMLLAPQWWKTFATLRFLQAGVIAVAYAAWRVERMRS